LALLAGRKLLLADDSITIQKVIDLTFADEGIQVVSVNNGAEAIEKLEEVGPDIVLADVVMPLKTGYEVCEYIKGNAHLKHIPVVLLVGSFEPFDEAEARRVGADEILTKPFQSIRNLIDKVGSLVGRDKTADQRPAPTAPIAPPVQAAEPSPVDDMAKTLKMPRSESHPAAEQMSTGELEIVTADTRRLSAEMLVETVNPDAARAGARNRVEENNMDRSTTVEASPELAEGFGETLLELGDVEPPPPVAPEDDILEIDYDAPVSAVGSGFQSAAGTVLAREVPSAFRPSASLDAPWAAPAEPRVDWEVGQAAESHVEEPVRTQPVETVGSGSGVMTNLPPDVIDAIARRVIEQLSEKVVREIAWEVVPQLAELLIKRKLEETESPTR